MITPVNLPFADGYKTFINASYERKETCSPVSLYFLFFITKHIRTSNFPIFHCDQFPSEMQPLFLKKKRELLIFLHVLHLTNTLARVSVLLPEV